MKIIFAVNGLCIAALLVAMGWTAFAFGTPEFQDRMAIVFALQAVCILFIGIRRILKPSQPPAEGGKEK